MPELPFIPDWPSMHPLLIHFPLVLLSLAPLFVLFAALTKGTVRRTLLISALSVMLFGLGCTYVAFEAGQAAAASVNEFEVRKIVDRHLEFASLARSSFTISISLFSLCLLICRLLNLHMHQLSPVLPVGAIAFYAFGLFWLVHTAYCGERLVHEFSVGRFAP